MLSFNDLISEHMLDSSAHIEDVLVKHSFDGTSCHVTLCGFYGQELATEEISDAELTALEDDLHDCNFIYNE